MGKFDKAGRCAALAALSAFAAGAAEAASNTQSCARGADVRRIEVISPGVVGAACDLKYVRDNGANVSVPYHANNNADFCGARARDLVRSLQDSGFECVAVAAPVEAAATGEGQPSAGEPATPLETASLAPAPAAVPEEPSSARTLAQPPSSVEAMLPPAVETLALEDVDPGRGQAVADEASFAGMQQTGVASRGPVALAPSAASYQAGAVTRGASAVGRITGAEPGDYAEERFDIDAIISEEAPAQEAEPAPAPSSAPKAETPAPKPVAAKPRTAQDVIKNVLQAQVAAWNDGDINAFMNGYWKSENVRFISGGAVRKGWNAALKQYKDNYGEGDNLGRLSFEGLEVQMVSNDVGLVVGRYVLARDGETANGVFSLVMKRFDGVWRIVADHSTPDAPSTE